MFADLLSQPSRSAMDRLLQFYTNPDLTFTFANSGVTVVAIPGDILRKKIAALDPKDAALKIEGIKREHVLKYLGLPETTDNNDPKLARSAELLSISTLLFTTSVTDAPKVRDCILEAALEKNPRFNLREDNSKLMAFLEKPEGTPESLTNAELEALYTKIKKALASSWDAKTRSTVTYVETGIGLPTPAGAVKQIGQVLMDTLKDGMTQQEIAQHKKQVAAEPGTDLKEIDFNGYGNTERKELIKASLAKLKHIPATSERVEPMFIEFNKIIRGIFDKYPEEGRTEQQNKQIEAKLKYTLNKLAVVLRQKKFYKEAEDIADHFNPDLVKGKNVVKTASSKAANDAEKKSFVKSIIDRLEKLTKSDQPQSGGLINGIMGMFAAKEEEKPTFKFKDFLRNVDQPKGKEDTKVGPIELPPELEAKIDQAGLDDKQLYTLVAALKQNDAAAGEAQRKLANRMQKLVRDLHEIQQEKKLQEELVANGVAFEAENPINKIQPLTTLFDNFEQSYKKLVARVKTPATEEEKKKAYFDPAAIKKSRDTEVADIQRDMVAKQRTIDGEMQKLQRLIEQSGDPEKIAEYQNRLDKLAAIQPQAVQNVRELEKLTIQIPLITDDSRANKALAKARELKEAFDKASEKVLAEKLKTDPLAPPADAAQQGQLPPGFPNAMQQAQQAQAEEPEEAQRPNQAAAPII